MLRYLWVPEVLSLLTAVALLFVGAGIGGFNGAHFGVMLCVIAFVYLADKREHLERPVSEHYREEQS